MNTFAPVSDLLTGFGGENWSFAPDFCGVCEILYLGLENAQ